MGSARMVLVWSECRSGFFFLPSRTIVDGFDGDALDTRLLRLGGKGFVVLITDGEGQ